MSDEITFFTLDRNEAPLPSDAVPPYTLGSYYSEFTPPATLYRPNGIIRGFTSVIWTERFLELGDVEIIFPFSRRTKDLYPIGTLVSHSKTRQVMIINYVGVKNKGKVKSLILKGVSFEAVLANRMAMLRYPPDYYPDEVHGNISYGSTVVQTYTDYESGGGEGAEGELVTVIEEKENLVSFPNNTGGGRMSEVLATLCNLVIGMEYVYFDVDATERRVHVLNSAYLQKTKFVSGFDIDDPWTDPYVEDNDTLYLKRNNLYSAILDNLKITGIGLKTQRPENDDPNERLLFVIHAGKHQTADTIPKFLQNRNHMIEPEYEFTDQFYNKYAFIGKNYGVVGSNGRTQGWGIDHKMFVVEDDDYGKFRSTDNLSPSSSGRAITYDITNWSKQLMNSIGYNRSQSTHPTTFVSFELNLESDVPVYKEDYDIGDIAVISGEFGADQFARVIEHTMSVTEEGIREVPTFSDPVQSSYRRVYEEQQEPDWSDP